ncbi:hypothetical protein [Fulvivirga sediminis]|uniref:Outer membrane lipoprotein carrier protein LolA n=1 Tax=Fulvivirga sediminis TaxID=2803949 RepID=A0A937JX38_9BACT|nr:hypothetical protein [Fulvivirga sediminis]MBL3655118.1 hypothetical protein [Fulvivirga sediminis]
MKLNIKTTYVIIFTSLLIAIEATGQDLKTSLVQMRKVYQQMSDLHIMMEVQAFPSRESKEDVYNLQVDIKKKGDNYLYHYGGNAMLMNDRYLIMIDVAAKEMVCSRRTDHAEDMMKGAFQFNLDSILSFYDEPEFISKDGKIEHFKINQNKGPVSELYLSIDSGTKLLTEMAYQYRQGAYVRIDFKLFDGQAKLSQALFNELNYISLNNGEMTPSDPYKSYHLVENTSN